MILAIYFPPLFFRTREVAYDNCNEVCDMFKYQNIQSTHRRMAIFQYDDQACQSRLTYEGFMIFTILIGFLGLVWAYRNLKKVLKINVDNYSQVDLDDADSINDNMISPVQKKLLLELGLKISQGSKEFLKQEYTICLIFVAIMFFVIAKVTSQHYYTAFAFLAGAIVSIACGSIGMMIATSANFRTAYAAKKNINFAFRTAYRAGVAMGFALVSIGFLILVAIIALYKDMMGIDNKELSGSTYEPLFEAVAGYGLGGSFVALFGRVGGGIYTKAADVGADLVGKIESNLPEDSPKNPATIADNVGDNVGDVAGMSADLFGSFAESTCAALVLSSNSILGDAPSCLYSISNFMFPISIITFGLLACIVVSSISTDLKEVNTLDEVQSTLKMQLILSTIAIAVLLILVSFISFPEGIKQIGNDLDLNYFHPYVCSVIGLVSGLLIAAFTEYFTSHSYKPVRALADSCRAGAGSNVTLGLALGYFSTTIPVILIAVTAYIANKLMGYYGVSLAALGMLSNLPLSLAIDGYGPISDNAGGIAEMAEMGPQVRTITDGLDAAGNTTAAIGKGFAIGSAALVSVSLYGGFIYNAGLRDHPSITLTNPQVFTGLLIGAMIPYLFSAFTIRSVGVAAMGMVNQVRRQIKAQPGILTGEVEPDYKACIRISTRSSLKEMIAPGVLVLSMPFILGFGFGPKLLSGFLPGAIVSGVQMAISASNTGGAWDNAKKYIESGALFNQDGSRILKGSDVHKAAVVGDTVGDPLKDTSGPALNILIKLMAIISLIFADKMTQVHPL